MGINGCGISCNLNTTRTFNNSGQCLCTVCSSRGFYGFLLPSAKEIVLGPVTAKANMQVGLMVLERRVVFMKNWVLLCCRISCSYPEFCLCRLADSCSCCPHCSPLPTASVTGAGGRSRVKSSRRTEFISPHFYKDLKRPMNTAKFMVCMISVMLQRRKKDQFIIKMVWLVQQLTSVGDNSKCEHCVPD